MSSSLQVGLRCARQCAYGVLLRWTLLLLSPAAVGASLRSPLAIRGRRRALAAADEGNSRKNNSTRKRKLLDPAAVAPASVGASLRSPLAIRGRRAATSTTTITTTSTTTITTTSTSVDFAVVGWMASSRCRR